MKKESVMSNEAGCLVMAGVVLGCLLLWWIAASLHGKKPYPGESGYTSPLDEE